MQASLIIAAYNEGPNVRRTIDACGRAGFASLEAEILVIDDGSTDGVTSDLGDLGDLEGLVRIERLGTRGGVASARDFGARRARAETLIFLDAHCQPDPLALNRLVDGVEAWDGGAIITPALAVLDPETWQTDYGAITHGSTLDLDSWGRRWIDLDRMTPRSGPPRCCYFESPALTGNAFAVARATYERIGGFDRAMRGWGSEDVDFALRAWLLGFSILHDPDILVAHCPGAGYAIEATVAEVVGNTLRSARKLSDDTTWDEWLGRYRRRILAADFEAGWHAFSAQAESADRERASLVAQAPHDLHWWIDRFQRERRGGGDGT